MSKKSRRWDHEADDDPLASMVNLFDLWIVVVVALVISLLGATAPQSATRGETARKQEASVPSDIQKLPRFQQVNSALTGRGERLGSAYRLESGEVVYVPDEEPK